jgi:branched-chain amino acid transport system substrate-binding protein
MIGRRDVLKSAAALFAALGAPRRAAAQGRPIRIGFVSPQTGALAPFGEADRFTIGRMNAVFGDGLLMSVGGGAKLPIQIVQKDSQSSPNRAGEVANDLILKDKVDLVLVSSTPETANPVCDACELNEVPCISTVVPWQPWFFGRNGDPQKGFDWTYHFFWGLEDVIGNFVAGWRSVPTKKTVGALFPNDGDGNAWGDKAHGFPGPLAKEGFRLIDPGRFQDMNNDFSAQIGAFKQAGVDIVTGVVLPPDARTFLIQARQQGLRPKVVTLGKALLFPGAVEALGDLGEGLSTEVWWSPSHPFISSLTKENAAKLADSYEQASGKQWTQPIGFSHALFEVAADALARAKDPHDRAALRDALAATNLSTVVGPVKFGGAGPFKNVCRTPLVLGQWVKGKKHRYELVIVNNEAAPQVPAGGKLRLLS